MNDMRKLMEAVQLDEYERTEPIYTEYRDPDGEFVVKYNHSRGYYAEGDGVDRAQSFENLDDAIEHAEISLSSGLGNEIEEGSEEGSYTDSDAIWYLLRDLRRLRDNTAAVYREASSPSSKRRPDYTEMLLNELRETLREINELYDTYKD